MNSASGIFGIHSLQISFGKRCQDMREKYLDQKTSCFFFASILSNVCLFSKAVLMFNFPLKYELTSLTNSPSLPGQCTPVWHKRQLMLYSLSEGNSAPAALAAASGSGYNYLACLNLTPASVKTYFSVSPLLRHPMGCSVTLSRY